MSRRLSRVVVVGMWLLSCAARAQAQTPRPPDSAGPLVLQPISESWVITPDVKFTPLKNTTRTIVGASVVRMMEDTFFLGGGVYGLVNGVDGMRMGYGGFIAGWVFSLGDRFSVQTRGLFGFGAAAVPLRIEDIVPLPFQFPFPIPDFLPLPPGFNLPTSIRIRTNFTIGEPQIDLRMALTRQLTLTAGAGYRLIGHATGFERWLRGPTGNVGLQVNLK